MKIRKLLVLLLSMALLAAACGSDEAADTTSASDTSADTGDAAADDGAMDDDAMDDESHSGLDIAAIMDADLGACEAAPSGEPIKVGMVMDFSEAAGFVDIPGSKLVPYVAELANCAGGVNGRPVEVNVRESGDDPALATQELIDWGAQFFIGPPFADATLPMQQTGGGEYAIFAAASTEPTLADAANNTFLVTFDDFGQSEAAAEYALSQGLTRAIVFTEGAGVPYSGVNPDAFMAKFVEGGGEIVAEETYAWFVDTDFSAQVNKIAGVAEGNEVFFSAAAAFQVTALRAQMEGQDLSEITYMGTDAMDATGVTFEDGGEGVIHTPHTLISAGGANADLFAGYEAAKGEAVESPSFMPLYVDSMFLGIQAILDCGCDDPAGIAGAVKEISGFEGTSGTITFAGTNGIPKKAVPIVQVQSGENVLLTSID